MILLLSFSPSLLFSFLLLTHTHFDGPSLFLSSYTVPPYIITIHSLHTFTITIVVPSITMPCHHWHTHHLAFSPQKPIHRRYLKIPCNNTLFLINHPTNTNKKLQSSLFNIHNNDGIIRMDWSCITNECECWNVSAFCLSSVWLRLLRVFYIYISSFRTSVAYTYIYMYICETTPPRNRTL